MKEEMYWLLNRTHHFSATPPSAFPSYSEQNSKPLLWPERPLKIFTSTTSVISSPATLPFLTLLQLSWSCYFSISEMCFYLGAFALAVFLAWHALPPMSTWFTPILHGFTSVFVVVVYQKSRLWEWMISPSLTLSGFLLLSIFPFVLCLHLNL